MRVDSQSDDAISALVALGFTKRQAEDAVSKVVDASNSKAGDVVKEALRYI